MSYYEHLSHSHIKPTNSGMQDPALVIGPEHRYWQPLIHGRVNTILPPPDEVLETIEVRDDRLTLNGIAQTFKLPQLS